MRMSISNGANTDRRIVQIGRSSALLLSTESHLSTVERMAPYTISDTNPRTSTILIPSLMSTTSYLVCLVRHAFMPNALSATDFRSTLASLPLVTPPSYSLARIRPPQSTLPHISSSPKPSKSSLSRRGVRTPTNQTRSVNCSRSASTVATNSEPPPSSDLHT